ncbi:MAG: enoyl-CoA hydratase/isomerase family protein [Chloroflexi bacterium]|nr:enoyl-CoA hydratase/isomerase family protein [Chloroflexota bacterium]
MEMIQTERREQVAIIKLNRPVTNALNLELVNELTEALQNMKDDTDVHSVVLSSSNEKFFSIGFDIPYLFELTMRDFAVFYRAFNRASIDLYTFPKPTIAAMPGHAIAGGCILPLCCDYRFIAQGRKLMGLNEVKLGVPVPYPVDCILREIIGVRIAREVVEVGEFYPSEELLQMGMVDQVVPSEYVMPKSIEKAESLGALPQPAFAKIKQNRTDIVKARILDRLLEKERAFIESWYAGETRERLQQAMEKF